MIADLKSNSVNTKINFNSIQSTTDILTESKHKVNFSAEQVTEINKNSNVKLTTTFYEPTLNEICFHQRRYIFNRPLIYKIEPEDDYFVMESDELNIVGTGRTVGEAFVSFAEEFQFIYNRYSNISDCKISKRLKKIKENLNSLVFAVE